MTLGREPLNARARRIWLQLRRWLPAPFGLPAINDGPAWPDRPLAASDFHAAIRRNEPGALRVELKDLGLVRGHVGASVLAAAERQRDEGYKARTDTPAFPLALPINWSSDPYHDANWRSQLHMLRLIDPYLRAHDEQPDGGWLRRALDIVLDWHRHLLAHGRQQQLAWRDMMVGTRALRLAHLFERVRLGELAVTPGEADVLVTLMALHARELTAPGFFRYTNHTVWDLHGTTALVRAAFHDGDPRLVAWMSTIGARLDRLVDLQFDTRCVHRENSPQYHGVVRGMFDALLASHWYDRSSARLVAVLDGAKALQHWMSMPDGRHIPIGDSDGRPPTRMQLPEPQVSNTGIEVLNHSCYGFVRQMRHADAGDWSLLAMKAGFDLPGHKHEDVLSYVWTESGCDIVVDSGKYAYDDTPMRRYMRSNRAHNLIEFGGRDSDVHPSHRTGHCLAPVIDTAWGKRLRATVTHRPGGERHERTLHFAPGRWLIVVDRFVAPRPTSFRHLTHLAPEFSARVVGQAFEVAHQNGGRVTVHHWSSMPLELSVVCGQEAPELQGWISRSYRQAQPNPVLVMAGQGLAAVTVLALSLDSRAALALAADGRPSWVAGADRVELDVSPLGST
ncbi:heparinase II/III domain-containing protein [Caldimonas sp. KR1-144]|uniref:heparinase II/III domain-containing protein n=1 Tax=Caldimonas sp. KR1-144 TaxID=3400911 RepID=UPI003C0DB061